MNQPCSSCVNFDTSDLIFVPLLPQSQSATPEQGLDDIEMNAVDDDDNFFTQGDVDIQVATDDFASFNDVTGSMHREGFAYGSTVGSYKACVAYACHSQAHLSPFALQDYHLCLNVSSQHWFARP